MVEIMFGGIAGEGFSIDTIERCSNEGEINGRNYVRWDLWFNREAVV